MFCYRMECAWPRKLGTDLRREALRCPASVSSIRHAITPPPRKRKEGGRPGWGSKPNELDMAKVAARRRRMGREKRESRREDGCEAQGQENSGPPSLSPPLFIITRLHIIEGGSRTASATLPMLSQGHLITPQSTKQI